MKRLVVCSAALWLCCSIAVPAGADQRNPFETDEAAIRIGNALFANRCALCHGGDAKGSLGPDLTQRWARGASDESAFNIIRNGVPGSSMPPNGAPDNELWAIVAYLRSVSIMPPLVASGDAGRGRELFAKECATCHLVRGPGGALGPDLSAVGATRSRAARTTSLREPSASIALGFRAVTATTRRGERVEGVVKGEDAFSIQIVTVGGELRAFRKQELAELERRAESSMPVYDMNRLSDAALEDLLTYLGTLRGAEAVQ